MPDESVKTGVSPHIDEEYKEATQAVVDDRMRTDVLGPRICAVIKEHTPARDALLEIIKMAIEQNPDVHKSLNMVIADYWNKSRLRWMDAGLGALSAAGLGVLIWLIERLIEKK